LLPPQLLPQQTPDHETVRVPVTATTDKPENNNE
jgi:hypothetical protein